MPKRPRKELTDEEGDAYFDREYKRWHSGNTPIDRWCRKVDRWTASLPVYAGPPIHEEA